MDQALFLVGLIMKHEVKSMNVKVKNVIEAMSAIDNADDMSAIAKAWKMQMNYISNMKKETFALKVGDKVNWTYRGLTKKVLFRS